jgi:protein gp37
LRSASEEFTATITNRVSICGVEDRKYGLPRIEHLRSTAAAVRFLSVEEPVVEDLGNFDLSAVHQVIVGGESGRGATD